MTQNRKELNLLLDQVEVSALPIVLWQPAVRFAIDVFALIEPKTHLVGAEALAAAIRIANGGDEREAEGVRIRCWEVITSEYRGRDIPDPDVSGLRAAICMLEMKQSVFAGDFLDNVDYFLTWANFVEDHTDDQIALFRKHFGQFLADE